MSFIFVRLMSSASRHGCGVLGRSCVRLRGVADTLCRHNKTGGRAVNDSSAIVCGLVWRVRGVSPL